MAVGDNSLLGYASSVGVSEEVAYGTKIDAFSYVEFNSESLKVNREEKKIDSINASRDFIKRLQLAETVDGSIEWDFNPAEDFTQFVMKQAFGGTVASAVLTTTNDDIYEHTFFLGDMENNKVATTTSTNTVGLSFQVDKGGRVWDFAGCRVNTLSIKGELGGMVVISAEIVGKTATLTSSTPTAVFSNIIPCDYTGIAFQTGDSISNLTATEAIQGFEFAINNNLAADNRQLGSRNVSTLPPLRREVTLKITQRFDTTTAHNIFLAGTVTAIGITLDSGQTMTAAASATTLTYRTVLNFPRCYYNGPAMPEVGGMEVLSQELEISAISQNTTTAYAVQALTRNLTANYEA